MIFSIVGSKHKSGTIVEWVRVAPEGCLAIPINICNAKGGTL